MSSNQIFTDKELEMLADGLLVLMENYNQAGKLVKDAASRRAIAMQQDKILTLLRKVTGMNKPTDE